MAAYDPASVDQSAFPHWVAWGSLAIALALFFANTVPAVRERASLQATEEQLKSLRNRTDKELARVLPSTPGGSGEQGEDLQELLLAIDRMGWTPDELLRAVPEPVAPKLDAVDQPGEPAPAEPRRDENVRIEPPVRR